MRLKEHYRYHSAVPCATLNIYHKKKVSKNCRLCRVPHGCMAGRKPLKNLKKSYLLFNKKLLNQTDMNQN